MDDYGTYSTQMDFVDKLVEFSATELGAYQKELTVASTFSNAICGIFALFYVANIVWKSWVNGGQIDLYKCFRPFVIGFLIINFTWMTAAVDFVAGGFTMCSREFVDYEEAKSKEMNAQFYQAMKTMDASKIQPITSVEIAPKDSIGSNPGTGKPEQSAIGEAVDNVTQWFSDNFSMDAIMLSLQSALREFIAWLAQLVASMVACCMILLSFIMRCILTFFGPLLFALSLLPHSNGMIMGWLRKYLTYSLYPAIMNIINGILCGAMCMVVTGFIGSTKETDLLNGTGWELVYINCALMAISICSIFIYLSIPSIAGQLVEVGSNAVGGAVMGATSYMMSKAGGKMAQNTAIQKGANAIGKTGTFMATGGLSAVPAMLSWGYNKMKGGSSGSTGGRKEAKQNDSKNE